MKKNYYFILCAIPALSLDHEPEINFDEFLKMLFFHLSEKDKYEVYLFRQYLDIYNLRSYWSGKEIDWRANLRSKQLEQALLVEEFLPEYVFSFTRLYEDISLRLKFFSYLLSLFFKDMQAKTTGFLNWFFTEERKQKIVLADLRAKQLKRDLSYELQFEDKEDFLVKSLLEQAQTETIFLPKEFEKIKKIFEENYDKPLLLHQKLLQYKLNKIEEKKQTYPPFTIDHILAYMAKLILIEDWFQLDENISKTYIDELLEGKL